MIIVPINSTISNQYLLSTQQPVLERPFGKKHRTGEKMLMREIKKREVVEEDKERKRKEKQMGERKG